jgi:hypothetical protein
MDIDARLRTEAICTRLIQAFAYNVDHRNYEDLLALFTEDGIFSRRIGELRGISQIRDFMFSRSETHQTRHLCLTTHFTAVGEEEAKSVTYFTIYAGEGAEEGVLKSTGSEGLAEYHDTFRKVGDEWRIAERRVQPVFTIPG